MYITEYPLWQLNVNFFLSLLQMRMFLTVIWTKISFFRHFPSSFISFQVHQNRRNWRKKYEINWKYATEICWCWWFVYHFCSTIKWDKAWNEIAFKCIHIGIVCRMQSKFICKWKCVSKQSLRGDEVTNIYIHAQWKLWWRKE